MSDLPASRARARCALRSPREHLRPSIPPSFRPSVPARLRGALGGRPAPAGRRARSAPAGRRPAAAPARALPVAFPRRPFRRVPGRAVGRAGAAHPRSRRGSGENGRRPRLSAVRFPPGRVSAKGGRREERRLRSRARVGRARWAAAAAGCRLSGGPPHRASRRPPRRRRGRGRGGRAEGSKRERRGPWFWRLRRGASAAVAAGRRRGGRGEAGAARSGAPRPSVVRLAGPSPGAWAASEALQGASPSQGGSGARAPRPCRSELGTPPFFFLLLSLRCARPVRRGEARSRRAPARAGGRAGPAVL